MNEKKTIIIHFNPDGIINPILKLLGEKLRLIAIAIDAVSAYTTDDIPDLTKYGAFWSIKIPIKDLNVLKQDLEMWLLESALSSSMTAVCLSLDEATKYYLVYEMLRDRQPLKSDSYNEAMRKIQEAVRKQHKKPLEKRVIWFEKKLSEELAYSEHLLTINGLRNCIVHRNGYVADLDINDQTNNRMVLKWIKPKIYVRRNGEEIEFLDQPIILYNGEKVEFKAEEIGKYLQIWDRVKLSVMEINQIGFTCWLFVTDIANKLQSLSQSLADNAYPVG